MIRSYLGYVEMIEMISRRLTKTQKTEILEAYKAGDNTNLLAEKYSCTANTINRTVKSLLSESEYTLLKEERSKITHKIAKLLNSEAVKDKKVDLKSSASLISSKEKVKEENITIKTSKVSNFNDVEEITSLSIEDANDFVQDLSLQDHKDHDNEINNQNFNNNFELIAPLTTSFDFDIDKKKSDLIILSCENLPESVYMIVDKKVELDLKPISDLPEWSFLPENELKRNAILLFANQRSAKRICLRNQRVIKIPNTSIFNLSKSYLISKGITRLILEDSLIALDD